MSLQTIDKMLSIFCHPCVKGRRRENRRQLAYHDAHQLKPIEEPLPYPPRKRALTLPGIDYQPQQQSSCLFFTRLPLEIRTIIYEKVIGGNLLHLSIVERRLQHSACWGDSKFASNRVHHCFSNERFGRHTGRPLHKDRDLLPILLTCHQA